MKLNENKFYLCYLINYQCYLCYYINLIYFLKNKM